YNTARDLADALEISHWTVHSWEAGKSRPRYEMLARLAELTDQPLPHFLGESPEPAGAIEDGQVEAGVYGAAPDNAEAVAALSELNRRAMELGVLLRFNTPVVVTARQLDALREVLELMAGE
ncbi:MAG: helix-turn-helix domain-containing protein, partial [Armatimonadetes bacterium]|nr:helix-turn-helix domain-containing protein [Armatimonadota bacterium]